MITFLAFGILVGVLARMTAEGEEAGGWALLTLAVLTGVAGALSGAYFGRIEGLHDEEGAPAIVMSLATAMLFVAVCETIVVRRQASSTHRGEAPRGAHRPPRRLRTA